MILTITQALRDVVWVFNARLDLFADQINSEKPINRRIKLLSRLHNPFTLPTHILKPFLRIMMRRESSTTQVQLPAGRHLGSQACVYLTKIDSSTGNELRD
jgi:hypothetical protein